ncbi:MAG: tetratricopeptide repeat protein, partial [Pseudohongiellaceae bacterium]
MGKKKKFLRLGSAIVSLLASTISFACNDLQRFYDALESDPTAVVENLDAILAECYTNSEYFGLLGAAYLRLGDLLRALESIERALLLDPGNGSAAVDFAEVLYRQGQLISAIEINSQLLSRSDLPEDLREAISARQSRWQRATNQKSLSLGTSLGYDNNLNSAPIADRLALTLSGNPVLLDVSSEFRAAGAAYGRVNAAGTLFSTGLAVNSRLSGSITGRFSEESDYDLIQGSVRYRLNDARDVPRWNTTLGLDRLVWGGNTVFSSATLRAGFLLKDFGACRIYPRIAMQYQKYEVQDLLSGYEYSLGAGSECDITLGGVKNRIGFEVGSLRNRAGYSRRLGGDRRGWQGNLFWQRAVGSGQLVGQYQYTKFDDEESYSLLFNNGAKRRENLHSVYLSYTAPLTS